MSPSTAELQSAKWNNRSKNTCLGLKRVGTGNRDMAEMLENQSPFLQRAENMLIGHQDDAQRFVKVPHTNGFHRAS